ncbi:hypothetical protein PR002_g30755 [Phytophthora rubi]|uniref:Uncharacterized protein n=1 Tax=Phytophthora rubi TaxID=129364 RepID=A0A6A3GQ14_9STRA|nr:hypothetical protein PR002_g30755 [Phytophthora rubi]
MGRVGLYGVANAPNIKAVSWASSRSASESSYYYHIVVVGANAFYVLLASPRRWAD